MNLYLALRVNFYENSHHTLENRKSTPAMPERAIKKPIPSFETISDKISYYTPKASHDAGDPILIILCTWMAASRKHIAKYTSGYQHIFPTSRILVIESQPADILYRPTRQQAKRLISAVNVMESVTTRDCATDDKKQQEAMLLITMSDGGVNSSISLANALSLVHGKPTVPVQAHVIDSAPSLTHPQKGVMAFSMNLPKTFLLRMLGLLNMYLFLSLLYVRFLFSDSALFEVNRRHLNAGKVLAKNTSRLYIYSEADELTDWREVEQHADQASACGYPVKKLKFEKSAHCAHVMGDGDAYWSGIKKLWDDSQN